MNIANIQMVFGNFHVNMDDIDVDNDNIRMDIANIVVNIHDYQNDIEELFYITYKKFCEMHILQKNMLNIFVFIYIDTVSILSSRTK